MLKEKDKVNILMNVDSYYGGHQKRMAPVLTYLLIIAAPALLYGLYLIYFIPFWIFLVSEVLFAGRMALLILGKEKERLRVWRRAVNDEFSPVNSLVRVSNVRDDGMVEYNNGMVAYILTGYMATYFSDSKLSVDLERVIQKLQSYNYDIYCHLMVDENRIQDSMDQLGVYTDDEMIKERMYFFVHQDDYCKNHGKLYRVNFVVKTGRQGWKQLRTMLEGIVQSYDAKVFKECFVCDRVQVSDVFSRDICAYVDLEEMLLAKYSNEDYFGSKVLFYGDTVPEKFAISKEACNFTEGRVKGESK